jgi:hypothetical protein
MGGRKKEIRRLWKLLDDEEQQEATQAARNTKT